MERICMYPWEFWVPPFRICGNLYYVGNSNVSAHLVDTGDGLILIDTTFPQSAYLLLESIRRLGFNPGNIRYILHCHGHYDHFGSTRALVELTGARAALGEQDIEIITHKPELSWAPEYGVPCFETFVVDMPLADGQKVTMGSTEVECVHIPGHTPGCMAFFFQVQDGKRRYTAGLYGGPGLNTLSTAYLHKYDLPIARRDDYLRSVRKMQPRHVDILLGAHPNQNDTLGKRERISGADNPFYDPAGWQAYLGALEQTALAEFGRIEHAVKNDGRN